MDKRKFKDGEKVRYNGCTYTIKEAHYMYYPNGKWWEYYLLDGDGKVVRVGEKLLEGIVIPPMQENAVSEAKKGKKRKKKNHDNETKET